jgi:hypothetical protein
LPAGRRAPDYEAESRVLIALVAAMADSPRSVFQKLADAASELCHAGSAGVSVWEPGGADVFRWRGTSGDHAPYLGGTVTAASPGEGQGSTFTVTLPELAALPEVPAARSQPGQACKGRRILVADDNRDAADSLAMLLGLLGHEVVAAHDGREAVEKAEAFRPEVILMDVGTPRLNGLEATRLSSSPWTWRAWRRSSARRARERGLSPWHFVCK